MGADVAELAEAAECVRRLLSALPSNADTCPLVSPPSGKGPGRSRMRNAPMMMSSARFASASPNPYSVSVSLLRAARLNARGVRPARPTMVAHCPCVQYAL